MRSCVAIFFVVMTAAGCGGEESADQNTRVRTIAAHIVNEGPAGLTRSFTGEVQAAESAALAFAVSGTIAEIRVSQGDRVVAGDVLAELDSEPYDLQLASAKAQLQSAQSNEAQTRGDLDRQRKLFEGGWVSPAALEKYRSAHDVAVNDVDAAEAQLAQMQRNLERTQILAPYDGTIADVLADPFTEASAGRSIIEINGEGSLELAIDAPDRIADRISWGAPVSIDASAVSACGCDGEIATIGRDAGGGNTIPVTISIIDPPETLLPGMTATATVIFEEGLGGAYIPFGALAAGADPDTAYVFRFDHDEGVVRRVRVGIAGGRGDEVLVVDGLSDGDVIAAAGAGLLRDGQSVLLPGAHN